MKPNLYHSVTLEGKKEIRSMKHLERAVVPSKDRIFNQLVDPKVSWMHSRAEEYAEAGNDSTDALALAKAAVHVKEMNAIQLNPGSRPNIDWVAGCEPTMVLSRELGERAIDILVTVQLLEPSRFSTLGRALSVLTGMGEILEAAHEQEMIEFDTISVRELGL